MDVSQCLDKYKEVYFYHEDTTKIEKMNLEISNTLFKNAIR